jgi:SnoaL-like domain
MNPEELLRKTLAAFNARDLDTALAAMHSSVEWPEGMESGVVHGHSGIREYWESTVGHGGPARHSGTVSSKPT